MIDRLVTSCGRLNVKCEHCGDGNGYDMAKLSDDEMIDFLSRFKYRHLACAQVAKMDAGDEPVRMTPEQMAVEAERSAMHVRAGVSGCGPFPGTCSTCGKTIP